MWVGGDVYWVGPVGPHCWHAGPGGLNVGLPGRPVESEHTNVFYMTRCIQYMQSELKGQCHEKSC